MADSETPVIFLHGIERHYRQGDAILDILKGAELAVWPGQTASSAPLRISRVASPCL